MSQDFLDLLDTCKSTNEEFLELLSVCRSPTPEIMKNLLLSRGAFSEAESDCITYMAGFSHREFAEAEYWKFGLSFLEKTKIFYDSVNNKFHIKVLLNDQTADLKDLNLWYIANRFQLPVIENYLQARDQNGCYVRWDKLRHLPRDEAQRYLNECDLGLHEYIVSRPIKMDDCTLVLHLVEASQNTPISLSRIFDGVSVCIFVNSHSELPNLSFVRLKREEKIHPALQDIFWYVLDDGQVEEVVHFLSRILANSQLVPYVNDEYDYLDEVLPSIKSMFLSRFVDQTGKSSCD